MFLLLNLHLPGPVNSYGLQNRSQLGPKSQIAKQISIGSRANTMTVLAGSGNEIHHTFCRAGVFRNDNIDLVGPLSCCKHASLFLKPLNTAGTAYPWCFLSYCCILNHLNIASMTDWITTPTL
jgi:hypothetical protein